MSRPALGAGDTVGRLERARGCCWWPRGSTAVPSMAWVCLRPSPSGRAPSLALHAGPRSRPRSRRSRASAGARPRAREALRVRRRPLGRYILCADDARFINHREAPNVGPDLDRDRYGVDPAPRTSEWARESRSITVSSRGCREPRTADWSRVRAARAAAASAPGTVCPPPPPRGSGDRQRRGGARAARSGTMPLAPGRPVGRDMP